MWEEDLPDSERHIDLVCIICGHRRFYPKDKYLKWKRKLEKRAKPVAPVRRTLFA